MIERVLVPIDGGTLSERSFAASVELARQLGARIVGFIVEPFASAPPPGGAARPTEVALHAHARAVLDRFEGQARAAGVPFEGFATQSGAVSEAIVAAAQAHRCDMIVMTTHGRGVVGELLWGSNTREVMARTALPVLVLH